MRDQDLAHARQQEADLVGRRLVAHADHREEPHPIALREVLERHAGERAVRDADDGPIERAHPGGAQTDLLDRAHLTSVPEEVAHPHRPVGEQRDAPEQILERLLGGERHRDAADAEAGHRRRHVHAEGAEDAEQPHHDDDDLGGQLERLEDGEQAHVAEAQRPGADGEDGDVDEPEHEPGRRDHDQQVPRESQPVVDGDVERQVAPAHAEEHEGHGETGRPAHHPHDALVERLALAGDDAAEQAHQGAREHQGNEPSRQGEQHEARPLPEREVEDGPLEEDRGQQPLEPSGSELGVELRDARDGGGGDLPDTDLVSLPRHTLEQQGGDTCGRLDVAQVVLPGGEPVVAEALVAGAERCEVQPELLVEDGLQLLGELRAPLSRFGVEAAQVQVLAGAFVVAVAAGHDEAVDAAPRRPAVEGIRRAERPGEVFDRGSGGRVRGFSGVLPRRRCGDTEHAQAQQGQGDPEGDETRADREGRHGILLEKLWMGRAYSGNPASQVEDQRRALRA